MKKNALRTMVCLLLVAMISVLPLTNAFAASKNLMILQVSNAGARLREGPDGDYEVITSLKKGAKVLYAGGDMGAFCLVCTADGRMGYVYRGYLESYGAVRRASVYYSNQETNVYKKSGSRAKKLGTMSEGQMVVLYAISGSWAYIKNLSGNGGYVRLASLTQAF